MCAVAVRVKGRRTTESSSEPDDLQLNQAPGSIANSANSALVAMGFNLQESNRTQKAERKVSLRKPSWGDYNKGLWSSTSKGTSDTELDVTIQFLT